MLTSVGAKIIICLLCAALSAYPLSAAQSGAEVISQTDAGAQIRILTLEGEGAINNIRSGRAGQITVRVESEEGTPLRGAPVTFILPMTGASGQFSNGTKSIIVVTDNSGRANVLLRPNSVAGNLQVRLTASHNGKTARGIVSQVNMVVPGSSGGGAGKMVAILAIISGAAAGGALAYTQVRNKDPRSGPSAAVVVPIVITPGNSTAGAPF